MLLCWNSHFIHSCNVSVIKPVDCRRLWNSTGRRRMVFFTTLKLVARASTWRSESPMELWAGLEMAIGPSVLKLRTFLSDSDVGLYPDSEAFWTSVPFSPFGPCPSPETNCNSFYDIFLPVYPSSNGIHSTMMMAMMMMKSSHFKWMIQLNTIHNHLLPLHNHL